MTQDLKTMYIKEVDTLSTHTKNCLLNAGIVTVQGLVDFYKKRGTRESRSLQDAGETTYREIYDFISEYELNTGISLRAADLIVDIPTFSTRTLNVLRCLDIYTVPELLDYVDKYGIDKIRQARTAGNKTIQEIRDFLSSYGAPEEQQIKKLKSKISKYELAIAQLKTELAGLEKKKNTTNKQQKEH